jgi:dTDP-4-amino-4,6-dideoxygalactose transaminase
LLGMACARATGQPPAQRWLREALASTRAPITDLATSLGRDHSVLLRYPLLLARNENRDALVSRLDRAGLGASVFYGKALAQIPGVPEVATDPTPNADDFAARLITLPVHGDVTPSDVEQMRVTLESQRDIPSVR